MMKRFKHVIIVLLAIGCLVVYPLWACGLLDIGSSVDTTSSATLELPDRPSGEYLILMNTKKHQSSLEAWDVFFHDGDFGVIFDDLHCLLAIGDVNGLQMATRYQAQLPENQMQLTMINPTLLVSKVEAGYFDVAIFSREMADALALKDASKIPGATVMVVKGGG